MPTTLIVGATRGLGKALASDYSSRGWKVIGTARSTTAPSDSQVKHWSTGIDISKPSGPTKLAKDVKSLGPIDVTIISAGYFGLESFDDLDWDKEVTMYITSAVAPPFIVHELVKVGALKENGGKVFLISSESGVRFILHVRQMLRYTECCPSTRKRGGRELWSSWIQSRRKHGRQATEPRFEGQGYCRWRSSCMCFFQLHLNANDVLAWFHGKICKANSRLQC